MSLSFPMRPRASDVVGDMTTKARSSPVSEDPKASMARLSVSTAAAKNLDIIPLGLPPNNIRKRAEKLACENL
ncbi:hypothetical protein HMSSN036_22980 [Paenibacillus macerans]|nr:hypothetical protein HMSSN036_22980 [Paenibacillus macerans]